jgi:hypothetical protein
VKDHCHGVTIFASFKVDVKNLVPTAKNENAKQKEEAVKSYVGEAL